MASRPADLTAVLCTPPLLLHATSVSAELADAIERSRDALWWARQLRLRSVSTCRIIGGGAPNDDAALVVTMITGLSLCQDCIARRTGIPLSRVDGILTDVARSIVLVTAIRPCAACLETKPTYGLDGKGDHSDTSGRTRTNGTQQAILNFLGQQKGAAFCAECIATAVFFRGKNIDVAMRHVEGNGVHRRHDQCSACGKLRLLASLPPAK